jgi:hypothetical protein
MHLGWGKDKDRAQGGITGYRALPNGEQVETIVFGDGAKSVENKRVNPHKVMEIIVNVYARGVNHLNPATNTLDSYWFESDPDPQESPGIPSNITYGVGVSYASQLNDGVIGMEAFQNATVNTYTDPKDPATDPYEQLLHRYGDKTSANATALAIEDQALAIASDASHDKDMSKLREVQHPRQLDVTGGRGQVLVAQVERNGTRESVNS